MLFVFIYQALTWTRTSPSPGDGLGMVIAFNCLILPYPCMSTHLMSFGKIDGTRRLALDSFIFKWVAIDKNKLDSNTKINK